ncbi:MAG: hypothetical protein ACI37Q_08615 [Candidatus Gastranaerophilaceae bacterium]
MVVNGVYGVGKAVAPVVRKTSGIVDDLLKMDDKLLDEMVAAAQKAKTGAFRPTAVWNCDARTLQEIGTKLAYNDLRAQKMQSLYEKYPIEMKRINLDGTEREFTIFKGSQGGYNEGYWARLNGTDELYYIKYGNEAQIRSEQLAGDLYELGGVPSTKKSIVSYKEPAAFKSKVGVASKYMPINCLPEKEEAVIVREGFGLDCWLANWDALKNGNVVMSAGDAARLDVGGSLCYRARGGRKGAVFGENVNELTSFFESFSHSKPYIKDMTRDELIASLDRVSSIPDSKIIETIDKTRVKNQTYLKETLIARKDYITRFREQCLLTPQNPYEIIEEYIRRIDNLVAKKEYKIPFEKIQMSPVVTGYVNGISMAERLSPSQKKLYEDSLAAFKSSAKNVIVGADSGNVLNSDMMLHSSSPSHFQSIMERGITSGDFRGAIGSGTGCATQTPLCADFWDINGTYSIGEYFSRVRFNPGEANFLPRTTPGGLSNTRNAMVFVVNKKKVAPTLMQNSFRVSDGKNGSILYQDGNMAGHSHYVTHRAVPIGVPINAVEKIIIRKEAYTPEAIAQIKDFISAKGLHIKLYDLNGNLL